ncbi:unnamed protein product, partial [marine sediment metagenome]
AGIVATTGYISITNNVSPIDLLKPGRLWEEYFYREKEPQGGLPETLPEEYRAIPDKVKKMKGIWLSHWPYDFSPGYWSEGEHSIKIKWVFPDWYDFDKISEEEEIDKEIKKQLKNTSPPTYETIINFKVDPEAKKHKGNVLFNIDGLYTSAGKKIENKTINPEDKTIFLIGWITDYKMDYEEAVKFYDACIVEISIDDEVIIKLEHTPILPHQETSGSYTYL